MRKRCAKLVEILFLNSGCEHKLCTILYGARQPRRAKNTFFPQFIRSQSQARPQAIQAFFNPLMTDFSPQSTMPINTITIHIN